MENLNQSITYREVQEEDLKLEKPKIPEPTVCTSSTPNPKPTNYINITTTVTNTNNKNNTKTDTTENITNDEELSDIISLPSITLTNDEYFRWIKNQSLSVAPTSPPFNIKNLMFNNSNAVIRRSDTMTTTHTISSMHHKSKLSNLNNENDDDNDDSDLVKLMEFKKKIESMDSYNFEDSVSEPVSKIENKANLNENNQTKDKVETIKIEKNEIAKDVNETKISNLSPSIKM